MFFLIIISLPHAFFASRNTHTLSRKIGIGGEFVTHHPSVLFVTPRRARLHVLYVPRPTQANGRSVPGRYPAIAPPLVSWLSSLPLISLLRHLLYQPTQHHSNSGHDRKNMFQRSRKNKQTQQTSHILRHTLPTRRGPLDLARTRKKSQVEKSRRPKFAATRIFTFHIIITYYIYNL